MWRLIVQQGYYIGMEWSGLRTSKRQPYQSPLGFLYGKVKVVPSTLFQKFVGLNMTEQAVVRRSEEGRRMMMRRIMVLLILVLGLASLGGTCGENSIYSERCRNLADTLAERIDNLAEDYGACEADPDCAFAAVVVPCNRDGVYGVVIARAEAVAFREAISQLAAEKCNEGNIDNCNPHCGTEGSLIFPTTGAKYEAGACAASTGDGSNASLASSEICNPQDFVYLLEDLDPGLPTDTN